MKYKLLGRTGLRVSELCFGTMTFGGKGFFKAVGSLGQEVADELIKFAFDRGINFIDTANIYSEGLSEEITGQSLHNLGIRRYDIILATKVRGTMGSGPNDKGLTRKHIVDQAEASLRRLKTDYIDLYQIHSYDPLTPLEETLRALDDLVKSGKVRYVGASNLAAWQLMKALAIADNRGLERFASLQAYYTVAGRDVEREIVPLLLDQQVGLMVWSPLAGGFLSGKYKRNATGEEGRRTASFDFPPLNKERAFNVIDHLVPLAQNKNATVAQLALAWLLHQTAVTSVIVGSNKKEQLEDNLKSIDISFSPEELTRIDEVSKLTPEYPGWMLERTSADRIIS